MNSVVAQYRKLVPNDLRSDAELTMLFGAQNDIDHRYDSYRDFVQDYTQLKENQAPGLPAAPPSYDEELSRGFNRGVGSLKSSYAGLAALAADAVGADKAKQALLNAYQNEQESAQENAPSVAKVEDVHDVDSAIRYGLGKAGELLPNIGEAAAFGAAGALAGSAVEPGGGTLAGGGGGFFEGLLARQSAKSLLRTIVEKAAADDAGASLAKLGLDKASAEVAKDQLGRLAKGEALDSLLPTLLDEKGNGLLADQAKSLSKKLGFDAANVINFYGQGAGGEYGQLASNPKVSADDAVWGSAIAGIGSAGSSLLPAAVVRKLFPGVGEDVASSYIKRLAGNAAEHIPTGVVGMGIMELANIAADRYADPEKRNQPLTSGEISRVLNAAVVGAMAGGAAAPLTAIKGPGKAEGAAGAETYAGTQTASQTADDVAAVRTLSPEERAFYAVSDGTPGQQFDPALSHQWAGVPQERLDQVAALKAKELGKAPEAPQPTEEEPTEEAPPAAAAAPAAEPVTESQPPAPVAPESAPPAQPSAEERAAALRRAAAVSIAPQNDIATQVAKSRLEAARQKTETAPTMAQKLAGNYPKGEVKGSDFGVSGFTIKIENPKGSERSGVGPDGEPWAVTLPGDYGQILGTKGMDGDPIDVTLGPNPKAEHVYVVDQIDPKTGKYDEAKTFLGFESMTQAQAAYDASFSDGSGPQRRGAVTAMDKKSFKEWLKNGDKSKAVKCEEPKNPEWVQHNLNVMAEPLEKSGVADKVEALAVQRKTAKEIAKELNIAPEQVRAVRAKRNIPAADEEGVEAWVKSKERLQQPNASRPTASNPGFERVKTANRRKSASEAQGELKFNIRDRGSNRFPENRLAFEEFHRRLMAGEFAEMGRRDLNELLTRPGKLESYLLAHGWDPSAQPVTPQAEPQGASQMLPRRTLQGTPQRTRTDYHAAPNPTEFVDVENRGVQRKSARGRGASVLAAEAWEQERARSRGLRPWRALTQQEREAFLESRPELLKRIKESSPTVEKAWFEPSGKEGYQTLAKRLLSESSPPTGQQRNSLTARLTALLDRDSGEVHLVSTFENNGEARVTKFTNDLGRDNKRDKSLSLRAVLGSGRYDVLGSARTRELTEYADYIYPDRKAFEEQFAKPVDEAQKAVESGAARQEQNLAKTAPFRPEEAPSEGEHPPETEAEQTVEPATEYEEPKLAGNGLNLNADEVKVLADKLPHFEDLDQLTDLITSRRNELGDELIDVMKKVVRQDPYFFRRVLQDGLPAVLNDYGYKTEIEGAEANAGEGRPVEQLTPEQPPAGVRPTERRREPGIGRPTPAVASGEDRSGQTQQAEPGQRAPAAQLGDQQPDRAGDAEVRFTLPRQESLRRALSMKVDRFDQRTPEGYRQMNEAIMRGEPTKVDQPNLSAITNGKPVFHETSLQNAYGVYLGLRRPFKQSWTNLMVSDNPESAIGQSGKGVLFQIDPDRVNGFRHAKPGTTESTGFEYSIDRSAQNAVQSVTFATRRQLEAFQKRFPNSLDYSAAEETERGWRVPTRYNGEAFYNLPELDQQPGDPESERLLQSIHEAATRAGIDVETVRGELGFGAYAPKSRTLLQVVRDTIGPQDVKTAFHEVGHDVFANEAPDVRDRLIRAVDRLSDEALGVDTSADSRIRAADPASLGNATVNEERLVEATADKLQQEGFDPAQANGYAQRFVRLLKDLYLRSALAVQRMLGFQENPELARRYFENRVKILLAGDRQGQSYLDFIGAGKPAIATRHAQWFGGQHKLLGERVGPTGLEYDHVPDLSLAAARFNLDTSFDRLKFRQPDEPEPYSRRAEIEKRVAVLNNLGDTLKAAAAELMQHSELARAVREAKQPPLAFLRSLLRVADPEQARRALSKEREPDRTPVQFDPERRLYEIKAASNRDAALAQAYRNAKALMAKAGEARQRVLDSIDHLNTALQRQQDEGERAATSKQLAGENLKLAAIEKVLPVFERELGKLAGEIGIGADFTFRHDAGYNVPQDPKDTSEAILKRGANAKLQLDSTGAVSNPQQIEEHLERMAAFLSERARQAMDGDVGAMDGVYQAIRRQFEEIVGNKNFKPAVMSSDRLSRMLGLLPVGRRMAEAFGTPAARMIDRMLNDFQTRMEEMHPFVERFGRKNDQLEDELLRILPKGITREYLRDYVLSPVKKIAQRQHDLEETYAGNPDKLKREIFNRVREQLLSNRATAQFVAPVIDKFMPALVKVVDHQQAANAYLLGKVKEAGTGVKDPKLLAVNPATGENEAGVRRHLAVGAYTFSQRFHREFGVMVNALRNSDWDSFGDALDGLAKSYGDEGPDAVRDSLARFFEHPENSDQVRERFFRALAEMDTESAFDAPALGDDATRSPADPTKVREAFGLADGDPVAFAEHLFDLHDAQVDKGQFVEDTMRRLDQIYHEINTLYSRFEPGGTDRRVSIRGMTPDAMINARTIEHLPGEWFEYHSYDQRDMFVTAQRIASQTAFGRGQERLGAAFDTVANEIRGAQNRLAKARQEIRRATPTITPKDIEAKVQKKLGKEAYTTLTAQASRAKLLAASVRGLSDFFRKDNSPDQTLNAATRAANALGMLLVNQPASAIRQLEQLFVTHLKYGLSRETLSATATTLKTFSNEAVRSLAQAVGWSLMDASDAHRLYVDLGLNDPAAVKSWHDAFDRLEGEGRTTHFFRGLDDLLGIGANRVGETAEHTILRPLQPFTTSAIMVDKGLTAGAWKLARSYVAKGMEFYQANPARLADSKFKLNPDNLGLRGASRDSFLRFNHDMERWGLNLNDMIRSAMQRGDGTPFTQDEALRLYAMGISELSSESNISTMPPGHFNNSVLRLITPLLGWPFRRMMDVVSLGRTPEGKRDLATLGRGLAGLSVLALGGLGVSALANLYQEQLLGKKSNLRPLLGASDPKEFALGVMENLNRAGTLGLLGEGINGLVNVGTGGDNRVLSVDQRVIALSSLSSFQQAISSWINQGQADYAHVVRPLAGSMGAGGLLQYMQLANHVLGMDNPEARVTARLNAQNWLRVVGRELGMDVRETGGGGYSNPTPLSPALTRMELAAYASDGADFQAAYREAVTVAKATGDPDAVGAVRRAYASRNPLRQVFRTPPSEADLRRLLAAMPETGSTAVREAIENFNRAAESIGARSFEGKAEKPTAPDAYLLRALRAQSLRSKALGALSEKRSSSVWKPTL